MYKFSNFSRIRFWTMIGTSVFAVLLLFLVLPQQALAILFSTLLYILLWYLLVRKTDGATTHEREMAKRAKKRMMEAMKKKLLATRHNV